ncbi:MAG TPA: hypothetical protein D7H79_03800 [Candidatus Poseidoniales archaeon]|nr:MAG TPA: hypothetical protein D7H79_03800 [Candidatus Poseidoniales archaeon]
MQTLSERIVSMILETISGARASGACTPGGSIFGLSSQASTHPTVTNPVVRAIDEPSFPP